MDQNIIAESVNKLFNTTIWSRQTCRVQRYYPSILLWIDNYNKRFPEKDYHSKYKNINVMEYLLEFEIKFNCFYIV